MSLKRNEGRLGKMMFALMPESYDRCERAGDKEADADYCRTLEMVGISSYFDAFQNGKSDIMPRL